MKLFRSISITLIVVIFNFQSTSTGDFSIEMERLCYRAMVLTDRLNPEEGHAIALDSKKDQTLQEIQSNFSVENRFPQLKTLPFNETRILNFRNKTITKFWQQLAVNDSISAASTIEQAIEDHGIETAIKTFNRIKKEKKYIFDENEFNILGYKLMSAGKIGEAVEVFKMNVQLFPESTNVHDSLGEGYLLYGEKHSAIVYYKKALQLNPENWRADMNLKRMSGFIKDALSETMEIFQHSSLEKIPDCKDFNWDKLQQEISPKCLHQELSPPEEIMNFAAPSLLMAGSSISIAGSRNYGLPLGEKRLGGARVSVPL